MSALLEDGMQQSNNLYLLKVGNAHLYLNSYSHLESDYRNHPHRPALCRCHLPRSDALGEGQEWACDALVETPASPSGCVQPS